MFETTTGALEDGDPVLGVAAIGALRELVVLIRRSVVCLYGSERLTRPAAVRAPVAPAEASERFVRTLVAVNAIAGLAAKDVISFVSVTAVWTVVVLGHTDSLVALKNFGIECAWPRLSTERKPE